MKFVFDIEKTVAASGYVLSLHGGSMNYLNLLKVLYWADKKALIDWGRSITGSEMIAMKQGPTLKQVNNLIRHDGRKKDQENWDQFFRYEDRNFEVHMENEPDVERLSSVEKKVLQEGDGLLGKLPHAVLINRVHDHRFFPEWKNPGAASKPIDPKAILEGACKSRECIETIQHGLDHDHFVHRLING